MRCCESPHRKEPNDDRCEDAKVKGLNRQLPIDSWQTYGPRSDSEPRNGELGGHVSGSAEEALSVALSRDCIDLPSCSSEGECRAQTRRMP